MPYQLSDSDDQSFMSGTSIETHIIGDGGKRRGRAGPQHLPPGGRLHVPHGHLIVVADGRDERGWLRGVGAQTMNVVDGTWSKGHERIRTGDRRRAAICLLNVSTALHS